MNYNDITMERHCVNSVQTTAMAAVKRFFCVFFILIAFVSNVLAETVTETYTVPSSVSELTTGTDHVALVYKTTPNGYKTVNQNVYWKTNQANTTLYTVTPTVNGTISFGVYSNRENDANAYYKPDGGSETTVSISSKNEGTVTFEVTAGTTYTVGVIATNLYLGGYTFTYESGEVSYDYLSVGSSSKTVSNQYTYDYNNCDAKYSSDEYRLMDCVHNEGYIKFKIKPTISGNYKLSSVIGTKYNNRYVEVSCNGQSEKKAITNNNNWSSGNTYDWTFENLEANTEYVVTITCTDTNGENGASDGEYQVNVLTTTIQLVADDSGDDDDDSGSSSSTWTSTVTGTALDYIVHTPSTQAYDQNGKPMTVVYLTNLGFTNISTVSNADNIQWLCDQGYQIIALDYSSNANAVSPKINADIISINNNLKNGTFLEQTCSPLRSYILMEGYRIERDIPYYLDDPTVYNYSDNYTTGDNLYLDLVYPASPSEEVPVLITFAYSNSYNGSEHQRMNLGNTWGGYNDSFVEGAPAVGFAWAVCDHPKYCDWGQGKYTGGANKSLASVEVNPDAACKVKAAIRTVRGKGESLGLNGAVAVTGFSRGSTAASLAVGDGDIDTFEDMTRGVSDYASQSSKVQCAVLGPGMFDYQSANTSSNDYTIISNYVSATSASFEQQGALATIQTNASAPTLFYHNTDDYYHEDSKGLYADQAATMKDKLDNLDVTTETITGYSSGHAVPQDETNLNTMYDFLTKHTVLTTSDDDDDSSSTETPEGTKNTLKIDFNYNNNSNYNDANYTAWQIDDLEPSDNNLPSCENTFGNVTIKIQAVQDTIKIKRIWYRAMLETDGSDKLINDGITGEGFKNNENYNLSSGRMAIKFTITGLSKGQHSIQAFHNNVEFDAGSTAPDIFVDVNGVNVLGNIAQTYREQDRTLCAKSYITFDVASSDAETEILYYTLAESDETYTRNNFCINSLEIDASDIDDFAQKPYPANLDWHVETPNNSVTLSWATAVNGADKHVIYFGTDEDAVKNGTAEKTEQTENTLTKTGLSPLKRYYWRVDEVKDGTTTEGDVWSFQPRRLAFPGADGAGKYAVGGRGYNGNGVVYHVTSLGDNVDNPTAGTLRYGVEKLTGPRTIVFDVAGVIKLSDRLNASDSYITVAGQTAPGIGVLLRDNTYGANGPDNITRFMNFRYGHGDDWDETSANQNVGGSAGMAGADNAIMDHCTMAWGNDEVFSSRNANDMTLQNCLIGESLNQNGHKNYWNDENKNCQHGYAASIGGSVGSFHHNLLAHNAGRNWSMAGGLLGEAYAGELSIYNNVVYNWYNRTTDGGAHNVNFVNNYYKKGAATDDSKLMLSAQLEGAGTGTQEYYVSGNVLELTDGSKIEDKEGTTYKWENKGQEATWPVFVDQPYEFWSMETNVETAEAAFKNVLCDVGANFAGQDSNSKRLIQETKNGTYSKTGSRSGMYGLIDKEKDSEGWTKIGEEFGTHTRPTGWDSDGDGIPAWFETAMGWDDSSPNNNEDSDGDYYTNLEEYLNWVAEPHFYNMDGDGNVSAFKNGTITLSDYFAGYTSPTYTVEDAGGLTVSISDDGTLTYSATQPLASSLVTVKVTATESGISLTREFNIYVEVDVEEKEYSLSQETYSYSNKITTWYFENGFTVTNNNSKGKSNGSDNTIKYSDGIEYTINIPEGISVNSIKFYGYTNEDNVTGYLSKLNGISYSESQYTFPSRTNTGERAEYTITFAEPVTNTITFTFVKQCAIAITLYATGGTEVETDLAPAFPGAEGHGRYAQGGRGTGGFTNVYHVTSLADDGNEGTLRWALAQDGPRTIVFDVSGYIDLTSDLQIPSYTTIAGQTAPEPGITLRYYTVNTNNSKNVIIRYMRFRRSQVKNVNDGADAAWGKNGKNIILDHCSFSWSIDEVASFYDNRNFTMQWCVLGEGLCTAGHGKDSHSYGGIWGGKNASFHHNMITNVQNRAPRLCGARYNWSGYDTSKYSNSVQAEQVDVRNNLYYNWGNGNGAYGGMGGYHNLVNNYYKAGPGTNNKNRVFQGSTNDSKDSNGALPDGLPGRFYINGNYVTAEKKIYDWDGFNQDTGTGVNTSDLTYTDSQGLYGTAGETVSIKLTEANEAGEVTTHTAENAYNQVKTYGGASLYRDDVDKQYMTDAENTQTSYSPTVSEVKTAGIVDLINDPEAVANNELPSFPMLAVVERPSDWDTDGDGIPDAWEDANGLDKTNSADGNLYTLDTEKGWYTNLEVYLNSIVENITREQNNNSTGTTIEIEDEYYPTWTEPDVTELEEFVLSNSTHASGTANEWTFSNRFVITGQSGTYESTGNYIKYSDGYEYTITVPSNVTVSRVKIEGYSNSTVGEDKAYLATLGTLTFDDTKYVFPNSNASVNTASYEFSLPETVTGGTIAIKATGAQACLIVTLYGTKEGVTLDDKENEMTVEEGSSVDVEYTIDGSTYKEANDDGTQYTFVSGEETFVMTRSSGKVIEYGSEKILENSIKYSADQTFTISIPDGIAITNFIVTGYTNRDNSEGGISTINDETVSYTFPSRTDAKTVTYDIEMNNVTGNLSFVSDLQCCYVITLKGTKTISSKKTTVTLDEMATVHDLEAAENVTVEMKRGLTAEMWNTFCVPFSLTKEQLQDALNDTGVEIVKYTRQEGSTLYFEDTDNIEAGKPYLIKPASFSRTYSADMEPIIFDGVNLVGATARSNDYSVAESVQPTGADFAFVGTYVRYIMETDGTELGLNTKNKLAKPAASPNNVMRGLRGFFRYDAGNGAGAKVVINGELTSIDEIDADNITGAKGVYHISGHFVRKDWNNGDGLQRGVYIVNGKKMVKY